MDVVPAESIACRSRVADCVVECEAVVDGRAVYSSGNAPSVELQTLINENEAVVRLEPR